MKKFLILQHRPNDHASQGEFDAFLRYGKLDEKEVHRIRMEKTGIPDNINPRDYCGIILGGGPSNASDDEDKKSDAQKKFEADLTRFLDPVIEHNIPFLGACYGIGAIATHQGGLVSKEKYSESPGAVTIYLTEDGKHDDLLKNIPHKFDAFVGHKESCQRLPEHATLLASSDTCPVQMFRIKENIYATQFHPELDVEGIIERINIYKHAGYFPPEDAQKLIDQVSQENIIYPMHILKNFVEKYRNRA